jgi:hypothetical protein
MSTADERLVEFKAMADEQDRRTRASVEFWNSVRAMLRDGEKPTRDWLAEGIEAFGVPPHDQEIKNFVAAELRAAGAKTAARPRKRVASKAQIRAAVREKTQEFKAQGVTDAGGRARRHVAKWHGVSEEHVFDIVYRKPSR